MDESALFTFLVEQKGGTYVRQLSAPTVSVALEDWRQSVLGEVAELSKTPNARFEDMDLEFVQLDGYTNVWCVTASVDDSLLLMNIVATAEDAKQEGKAI
jgi:hypothetical protein